MKNLKKNFMCYGHSDVLNSDEELLDLSKEAGCIAWFIGFESISQKAVQQLDKKPNRVDEYKSVIKKIHDRKMAINGHFVFGTDSDTPDVFDLTINAILNELKIDVVAFMIVTPIPGSPMFDRLEREGRILTKDWSKYTGRHVVFKPKNMSEDELRLGMWKVGKTCNSFSNCVKRSFNSVKLGIKPVMFTFRGNFSQMEFYRSEGLGI
jgi:radical SAM superfamily enzyme YgiQ (UPF0313 family)